MTPAASSVASPRPALLQFATALAEPDTRAAAAHALAQAFGGTRLMMFVLDPEIGSMLAAPGFPQSMPNGRLWRAFLERLAEHGELSDSLPVSSGDVHVPVIGYGFGPELAFVLVGTTKPSSDIEWFRTLLPMYGTIFRAERAASAAVARERLARETAARASRLMDTLDRTRRQLESALTESREKSQQLEAAIDRLRHQAEEMAAQAEELEAQADDLQATNAELVAARATADAANRAKTEFLATMSHELRTPLNAIAGHVQLIEIGVYGPVTDDQRAALARVDRAQRHLLGLINNILNLSRIEAGRVEYLITSVLLDDALRDLDPMIRPQLQAKSISYSVRQIQDCPPVAADREKLQQILLNLLSNAVKFTDSGGTVSVEGGTSPGKVHVRVVDTGRGIPADKIESIFEPFTQVDSSHSRAGQGTGLGLAISRDLARGMGGELRVRSQFGLGSSFTLTLNAAPARTVATEQAADISDVA